MVIVISSVNSGFSWVDLVWLAASSDRLQLTVQLHCEWLEKNKAANAPIIFEKIVMVIIR